MRLLVPARLPLLLAGTPVLLGCMGAVGTPRMRTVLRRTLSHLDVRLPSGFFALNERNLE